MRFPRVVVVKKQASKKGAPKKASKKNAPKKATAEAGADGRFSDWKEALKAPERVEELRLDVKQLPRVTFPSTKPLPADIARLENLRKLEIKARNLGGLCEELAELEKLTSLSISNTEEAFDAESLRPLPGLKSLVELELYNVGLTSFVPLPESLESLSLRANDRLDVEAWCRELSSLPKLRSLDLAEACRAPLPASIGALGSLRSLVLSSNGYDRVPDAVLRLTKLERLDLAVNAIRELPREIGALRSLKWLALQSNAIETLEPSLGELSELEVLLLGANPLRAVPDVIIELKALRVLDLGECPLSDVPPGLTALPLEQLTIDAPVEVVAELRARMPACKIVVRTKQDAARELEGWLRFFGKR